MHQLRIDYHLDGPEPGYRFKPSGTQFKPETLRTVWRQAMPRGQGWADYVGANSLKIFQVNNNTVAVSEVLVTDQADEAGRRGIRQADIRLMGWGEFSGWMHSRLEGYPQPLRRRAERSLGLAHILQAMSGLMPAPGGGQVALSYPWQGPGDWVYVECLLLMMSRLWALRAARGWPRLLPITTLALECLEESPLLALPRAAAPRSSKVRVIALS